MNVRQEILSYAKEEDKLTLLWLIETYSWRSQWNFVAKARFEQYGPHSFQANRIWSPTKEGRLLYEHKEELL